MPPAASRAPVFDLEEEYVSTGPPATNGNFFCSKNTPERGLIAAVLARVIQDLTMYRVKRADRKAAYKYVVNDTLEEWGFVWCCSILDLEHETLRKLILEKYVEFRKGNPGLYKSTQNW